MSKYPERIGFHSELQHYGLSLPGGDKFEWTKDVNANAADLALVFAAAPLVSAGVDVDKLVAAGWLYTPATTGAHASDAVLIRPISLN